MADPSVDDGVDLGGRLNSAIWGLAGAAGLFLALRLYCKIWRTRKLWWDDHFLVIAFVSPDV